MARLIRCAHAEDAACLACQDGNSTDGVGFPHPGNCRGRTPVRECRLCGRFVRREEWRAVSALVVRFGKEAGEFIGCRPSTSPLRAGCARCVPDGAPVGAFPRALRVAATSPEDRE
jgi:hypothetical protein